MKQLPPEIRDENPEVEWRKIAGLRVIIVDQYFNISDELIEDILLQHLPKLKKKVEDILEV